MNSQNRYKKITFIFYLIFLSSVQLNAQYFQSVENSFIGCWKLKQLDVSERVQYYCFLEDKVFIMSDSHIIEEANWKICRDSIVTEQHVYKNIGGHVLNIGDYYFAILVVTEKTVVLMDLYRSASILTLKKIKHSKAP